jgi:hypothetical protein
VSWDLEYFDDEILSELLDSDALAEVFADQENFKRLAGSGNDVIAYTMRRALDPVAVIQNWKSQQLMLDPLSGEVLRGTEVG